MATMLEKLGFRELVENTITCSRETRVMSLYKFVLGIVLGLSIIVSDHRSQAVVELQLPA